jgi:membrane associated rhomboid family serine protease
VFRLPPLTPFVRALLVTLIISFVVSAILENFVGVPVVQPLALQPVPLTALTALQVFSHVLIIPPDAGGVFSLLLSLLFLWICLVPIESSWSRTRAIQLTLAAAVGSSLPALLVGLVLPAYAGPVLGPSAITSAAVAAYVASLPSNAVLNFGQAGIPARNLLWFFIALDVMFFLVSKNAAQLAADFGALGTGLLFTRYVVLAPRRAPRKRGGSSRLRLVKSDDDDEEPKRWLN